MKKLLLAIVMLTSGTPTLADGTCNLPPSQWCRNRETALRCGVTDVCEPSQVPDTDAGPVNFSLYYGSLCNACLSMLQLQLYPVYTSLGESVINLTLVPYGNTRENKTTSGHWVFDCQYGPEECLGNIIQLCALHLEKNKTKALRFIHCLNNNIPGFTKAAGLCAPQFSINYNRLTACVTGDKGAELEHEMAVMTRQLSPPHTYVPWITVNGVHTEKINDWAMADLLSLICQVYTGPTPDACKKY